MTIRNLLFIFLFTTSTLAQTSVFDLNKKLGKGVNLGNMFEAPSETAWGNPFKDEYIGVISDMGFNHIRIPITWDVPDRAAQMAPYALNTGFLNRIKHVIDLAKDKKMMVIINMHHHNLLFENPEAQKEKFLKQWEQIGEFFRGYDENLIFEILNEPHGNLSPKLWNSLLVDALTVIRKSNPTRAVLIGTANYGGLGGLAELKLPADNHLIVTIHYYEPFQFTHQGADWVGAESKNWLGTKWENTDIERNSIENQFVDLKIFSKKYNVPVNIGEFGAFNTADMDSRVQWTNFLARWFEQQGYSWAYWEFSAGFGVYDPTKKSIITPLADALLKNQMAAAKTLQTKVIYESNFNNTLDWTLNTGNGSMGNVQTMLNSAQVSLTKAGTESWHTQFVKSNISLEKDKRYVISFTVKGSLSGTGSFYIGRAADPWDVYSSYQTLSVVEEPKKYQFTFVKTKESDPKARFVFDLGKITGTAEIKDIKIEKVLIDTPVEVIKILGADKVRHNVIQYYPCPVIDDLIIEGLEESGSLDVLNYKGFTERSFKLTTNYELLNFRGLNPGMYHMRICSHGECVMVKIIKR